MMPQLNGVDLGAQFKAIHPECKVLLFSGQASTADLLEKAQHKGQKFEILAKPGARPFEMRGREMKGWLRVDAESVATKRALEPWAMQSVAFARALPPTEKK